MTEKRTCGECATWWALGDDRWGHCNNKPGDLTLIGRDQDATDCPAFERKEKP